MPWLPTSARRPIRVIISYVSEADAETIRASYDALNAGDVQGALEALHRDAVWRESPELPGGDTFEGRAAIEEFLLGFLEQWETFHQHVTSTVSEGDRVAVLKRALDHVEGRIDRGARVALRQTCLVGDGIHELLLGHVRSSWSMDVF